jgi:uncharacterized protein Yka (UPF0111/DUF47 family)
MIEQSMRTAPKKTISDAAQVRLIKKEIAKLEKQIEKVQSEEKNLLFEQEAASFDHQKLIEIAKKLETIQSLRQKFEDDWLELSGKINE